MKLLDFLRNKFINVSNYKISKKKYCKRILNCLIKNYVRTDFYFIGIILSVIRNNEKVPA